MKQSKAKPSVAKLSKQSKAKQKQSKAKKDKAEQSKANLSKANLSNVIQTLSWGRTSLVVAVPVAALISVSSGRTGMIFISPQRAATKTSPKLNRLWKPRPGCRMFPPS